MSLSGTVKRWVATAITSEWIGRLVRLLLRDSISFGGLKVASCSPWVPPKVSAQLFWGIYESAERRFVQAWIDPDLPTIELGSSIGGISSHVAQNLSEGQMLICVEANPHLLPLLEQNLQTNARHLDSSVVHGAVSTEQGTVQFSISASSLSSQVGKRSDATEIIEAPTITLSSLLSANSLDGLPFQLVMDIEGAEAGVVFEEATTLAQCRRIVVELHETEYRGTVYTVDDLIVAFTKLGFVAQTQYGPVIVFDRPNVSQ